MRNELIYEAYMEFMLKSLFLIGSLFLLVIATMVIIDLIFILFAPRQKGMVIRADIAPVGRETRPGPFYAIFIFYEFNYEGKTYRCSNLNTFGRVIFNSYDKANKVILNCVTEKEIVIYICPFNPKLSIVLPLKIPTIIKVFTFLTFFAILFVGDQIGVIDIFPNLINMLEQ